MGDRDLALAGGSATLVEYVCMAAHKNDAPSADGHGLTTRSRLHAYCARGADQNHEWVRVPATPLDQITSGKMEDRPPEPCARRERLAERG